MGTLIASIPHPNPVALWVHNSGFCIRGVADEIKIRSISSTSPMGVATSVLSKNLLKRNPPVKCGKFGELGRESMGKADT